MPLVRLEYLVRGLPGHPIHPPLTDATIGIYTFSLVAAVLSLLGVLEEGMAQAWWVALIVGLLFSAVTAATGWIDWLTITPRTPLRRTALTHGLVNLAATAAFAVAAIVGHADYADREVGAVAFVLTLLGYVLLTVGGWLGGTIVFVHGMRVLNLVDEPTRRAAAPAVTPQKEAAEGREL
jgi:uncharacterized membrane protein